MFVLAEDRLDGTHDPLQLTDRDPVADLERFLPAQVAGRDDLVAATELIAVPVGCYPGEERYAAAALAFLPVRRWITVLPRFPVVCRTPIARRQ